MIRDATEARRLDDRADLVVAAAPEQAHRSQELFDRITTSLFRVGLSLQAASDLPGDAASQSVAGALYALEDTIRQIRDAVLTTRDPRSAQQFDDDAFNQVAIPE